MCAVRAFNAGDGIRHMNISYALFGFWDGLQALGGRDRSTSSHSNAIHPHTYICIEIDVYVAHVQVYKMRSR